MDSKKELEQNFNKMSIHEFQQLFYEEEEKSSKILELRERNNNKVEGNIPVVATGVNIRVKEQFAQLELYYLFWNNGEKRAVDLVVNKIEGTHSGVVKVYKNPSPDQDIITSSKMITDGYYETIPDCLAQLYTCIELKEEIEAKESWRVVYTFYWPVACSNDGKTLSFKLPKEVYQVVYDKETFKKTFADKLRYYKFQELNEYFFSAPFQIKVKEICSQNKIDNMKITSKHQNKADKKTEDCIFSVVNSIDSPSYEDFSFQWQREITSPDEPISVLEFNMKKKNYYLYLKAFPRGYIQEVLDELCESLDKPLSPNRKYLFTIVLDTGSSVLPIDMQDNVKNAAKSILTQLRNFNDQEQIAFRVIIAKSEDSNNQESESLEAANKEESKDPKFELLNEKTLEAANKEIDEICFSEHNIDLSKSLKSVQKQFSEEEEEENEENAHRYIFISSASTNTNNLITDMTELIKENGQIRFYYISVEPKIKHELRNEIIQKGTGIAVCIKDEIDLEEKIESVVTHALRPYNYQIELSFGDFPIIPVKKSYLTTIRGANECIEFLGSFSPSDQIPPKICVSIYFNSCEGAQLNFIKNIYLVENQVKDYFISVIANDIVSFERIPQPTFEDGLGSAMCCGFNSVFYKFNIIYGARSQILNFPQHMTIGGVKREIIAKLKVKSLDLQTLKINGRPVEDSSLTLEQLGKFKDENTIEIPVTEHISTLPDILVKKINKEGLFVFDGKLVMEVMGISKDEWTSFEKETLNKETICKKLFNIQAGGITKDNRNIAFSYYCLFYLRTYLKKFVSDVERELNKVGKALTFKVEDYSEKFQKEFNALVNFTPKMFK